MYDCEEADGNLNDWGVSECKEGGEESDGEATGNRASSREEGGNKATVTSTSCDAVGDIRASDDDGSESEEDEEGQKSVSGRVGGLCETAIDLSQDDDDETGDEFF